MITIKASKKRNLCYIKLDGYLTDEELVEGKERLIKAIGTLQPNLNIINDISTFSPAKPDSVQHIVDAQMYAFRKGVNKVIRVVKNPISRQQFERLKVEAGLTYQSIEVGSYEEAMALLD